MVSETQIDFSVTDDRWRRALIRAAARGYEVEFLKTREFNGIPLSFFRVNSNTHPGEFHYLSVGRLNTGWIVNCDCPAGEHHKVCVHAAAVLRELAILSDPDPGVTLSTAA